MDLIGALPLSPTFAGPIPETPARLVRQENSGSVEEAAKQFEGLLLTQLLKEMRQTLQPGGMFAGDAGDVQGGLFDLFLSQHLTQAGGFGLAEMLKRQLGAHHDGPPPQPKPIAQ